jgi:hypothetical protein
MSNVYLIKPILLAHWTKFRRNLVITSVPRNDVGHQQHQEGDEVEPYCHVDQSEHAVDHTHHFVIAVTVFPEVNSD